MIKYSFKEDEILAIKGADKANPQKIGEALADISAKAGGHLTPAAVVDAAKDRKSVLHRHFEWDDAVAANQFRLDQARSVIRAIHVENADASSGMARAFVSIREKDGTSYRSMEDVLASSDLQSRLLAKAEADLIAWEHRYQSLEEVCNLVRAARERLSAQRSRQSPESRTAA